MKHRLIDCLVLIFLLVGCKKNEDQWKKDLEKIDTEFTLHNEYDYLDVRRYGLFPGKPIGGHPKNGKNVVEALLDLAELGVPIRFPEGFYKTALKIQGRKNIKLYFNNTIFAGLVEVRNSNDIHLMGSLSTLEQFYTRDSENIQADIVFVKKDSILSINNRRPYGCSIHSGTKNLTIKKLVVEDVGSGTFDYKFVKGGLIIHGHNNEPEEINIDSVIIKSSDRHGAYISGENIEIDFLSIEKFGVGSGLEMAPMEGGILGDQLAFSGLWIKNCFNSSIKRTEIKLMESGGVHSLNMDYGETFRPVVLDTVLLIGKGKGSPLNEKYSPRTGVKINFLKHLNE
ncbi:hypothetical protein MTsPCn5_32410 [Croceitalea sp. MTPC5]|uniref:hypothetical protein n=1 Tax=Croceitalea sp. MTPC5 TaxID=3056565 RepID=UPI002B38EE71|nr:hypothetical protein MTsPCn5_32410 [Croceitalea sp. MTPC5]